MLLEQLVYVETAFELKKAPNLSLRQRTGPIRLNGDRLERASRNIVPLPLERCRNVIRQVYGDLHGDFHSTADACSQEVGEDRYPHATRAREIAESSE
jgi:hypothetical protein